MSLNDSNRVYHRASPARELSLQIASGKTVAPAQQHHGSYGRLTVSIALVTSFGVTQKFYLTKLELQGRKVGQIATSFSELLAN